MLGAYKFSNYNYLSLIFTLVNLYHGNQKAKYLSYTNINKKLILGKNRGIRRLVGSISFCNSILQYYNNLGKMSTAHKRMEKLYKNDF